MAESATLHAVVDPMEDGRWFASIVECPGVWADGDSMDEALDDLSDVLRGWLAVHADLGHAVPISQNWTFTSHGVL